MRKNMALSIRCIAAMVRVYVGPTSCQCSVMSELVTIPYWALILVLLLAAIAAIDRVLGPSLRWFLRRRMERAVARLNKRLERPIQPFKLLARSDTVNRVVYSPEVMAAVQDYATQEGLPEQVAFVKARTYAREIVPFFSTAAYFGFAIRAAKLLSRSLYRVRLGAYDEDAISLVDPDATVIFVMNHRSNMDYVLVTYLVAERSALAYAVGEWARIWPLRAFVQSLGGYFIRRRSNNALYRRVLARYVQLSTKNGVTQAIFPEGGLSLDGKVGSPKLGLLSYVIQGFEPDKDRDVVFVPVGINYDRVLEDKVLVGALERGDRRFKLAIRRVLTSLLRNLLRRVTGRFHRYGYAAVSFGAPISLRGFLEENPSNDPIHPLGETLTKAIRDIIPVLPVPLMAAIMVDAPGPMSLAQITNRARALRLQLVQQGAHLHLPRDDPEYEITVGLRQLIRLKIITLTPEGYVATPSNRLLLQYYANSVVQLLPDDPQTET